MDNFLAHSLGLIWLSVGTARRLVRHPADRLLAAALLTWGNLTVTHRLLVLIERHGELPWTLGTSFGLAMLLGWLCSRLEPATAPADASHTTPGGWAALAAGLTLLALAPGRLFSGYLDQPDNPELLNTTAWLLGGFALYRLGRVCALGANPALVLSWLGLAAGLVVVPFGLRGPALPATAGVLAGMVFACHWKQNRRQRHSLLVLLAAILVSGGLSGHLHPDLRWTGLPPAVVATALPPADTRRLFLQDLVLNPETGPVRTTGLRPAEGPYPLRGLPRFRSVRQPGMSIVIPGQTGSTRMRISYSLGLLQRDKTDLVIRFNGRTVRQCRLSRQDGWTGDTLELQALPGENVIEFVDVPHQQELDWRGYLERYSDVMRHIVAHNIPLEAGALEHYRISGRPEGRIMLTREISPPVRGAYFFVFRQLELEGFR